MSFFGDLWGGLSQAAQDVGDAVGDAERTVANVATDVGSGNWSGAIEDVGQGISDVGGDVGDALQAGGNAIGDSLDTLDEIGHSALGEYYDYIPIVSDITSIGADMAHEAADAGALGADVSRGRESLSGAVARGEAIGERMAGSGVDAGISYASGKVGGKVAGKMLGKMGAKTGGKALAHAVSSGVTGAVAGHEARKQMSRAAGREGNLSQRQERRGHR